MERATYDAGKPPSMDERRTFWDGRYATEGWVFGLEPNRFVVALLDDLPPSRVLDLGCGQGRNAIWLAQRGHTVTGIDLSPVAVEQATQLATEAHVENVRFLATDLTTWEPDEEYDVVLLSYLQVIPEHRMAVHDRAKRALAPGGRVVLIAHHPDNLIRGHGGPQLPEVLFDEAQLAQDFSDLTTERLEAIDRTVTAEDGEHTAIDIIYVGRRST